MVFEEAADEVGGHWNEYSCTTSNYYPCRWAGNGRSHLGCQPVRSWAGDKGFGSALAAGLVAALASGAFTILLSLANIGDGDG